MRQRALVGFLIATAVGCETASDTAPNHPVPEATGPSEAASESHADANLAVYAAAARHVLLDIERRDHGVLFITIGGEDPPPDLLSVGYRPGSQAEMSEDPVRLEGVVRDRVTGERGTHLELQIVEWLADDRVKVDYSASMGSLASDGYQFYLQKKGGQWVFVGEVEDSYWVS